MKETLEIQIENYEKPIKGLIGKTISDVNYYEIDYGEPSWNESEYHSLDYGLELITSDKESYYFIWGKEYAQFDVKFKKGNIQKEFSSENSAKKHNVIGNQYWTELIGQKISLIRSNWSYWRLIGNNKKNYYPQDVEIEFGNGKIVWISALEITDGNPMGMKDNLTVIFDKKIIDKFKVGFEI